MSPKVTRWRPLDTVDKGRQACGQRKRRKLLLRWPSTRALSLLLIPPSNPSPRRKQMEDAVPGRGLCS